MTNDVVIRDEIRKCDSIIHFVETNKDASDLQLKNHLDIFIQDLAILHGYYTEGFDGLLQEYLKLPHSSDLQSEILDDVKPELQYLRNSSHKMCDVLKQDNVQRSAQAMVFLFAVQKYLEAASGIFQHFDGHRCDLLEFMNESGFTLKENYKYKYPSVSLNFEFRTETGKLLKDDLGYKMYCVNKTVKEEWQQVALAYGSAKNS